MEFVVVATHNERFFESFIDSLEKFNIKPTILGWGQKYTGHLMKDDLLEKYLQKTIKNKRVIIFSDAFDCLLLKNPQEMYKQFLKLNKDMVISSESSNNNKILNFLHNISFDSIDNKFINTGMIMGKNNQFLKCLKIIKKYRENGINSNQKIWSKALKENNYLKSVIYIDYKNILFYNHHSISAFKKIQFKNNKFYIPEKNSYPFLIQGNGNRNINDICKIYNIKESIVKPTDNLTYVSNSFYYYVLPYITYIILLIFIIIIIIFLVKKLKKKK